MSDSGDHQDQAESLDDDKLEDGDDYGDDGPVDYPPDAPAGVNEDLIEPTAAETVTLRSDREEPDPLVAVLEQEAEEGDGEVRTPAERMLDELDVPVEDPDDDQDGELDQLDLLVPEEGGADVAPDAEDDDEGRSVGTLVDLTPGFDDEEQAVSLEGPDTGDETAEEAAMHIEHDR